MLVVIDQAYREYVNDPDYPDAIEEYFKAGRPVAVRTFSKVYGLAGLRVGYMVAPKKWSPRRTRSSGVRRLQRGAVGCARQPDDPRSSSAAAASTPRRWPSWAESSATTVSRRRAGGRELLYVDVGDDSRPLFEALLREGVIVRPLHGFGAPTAIRVTSGTVEETQFFADAFASARGSVSSR